MIKLSITLERDPEHPEQWTSICPELDVISAGTTPECALEAVAEAVRMVVQHRARRAGMTTEEAFERLAEEVAVSPRAPEPDARDLDLEIAELKREVASKHDDYLRKHEVLCQRNGEITEYRREQAALVKALGAAHLEASAVNNVRDAIHALHNDAQRWLMDDQSRDRPNLRAAECRIAKLVGLAHKIP